MHLPVNVQLSEHDILPKGKVSYLYKVLDRLLSSLPALVTMDNLQYCMDIELIMPE